MVEETRSERMSLVITPSLKKDIEILSSLTQESMNGLINRVLQETVDENREQINQFNNLFEKKK